MAECLEVFQEKLNRQGEALILDEYIPADGTYLLVQEKDGVMQVKEPAVIQYDKKTREISGSMHLDYHKFRLYDYYSKLVAMNKPIDGKKVIHSNNYLSFAIKKESLFNGKLTQEIIDGYYEILLHPENKYSKSPKAKQIYRMTEEGLAPIQLEQWEKAKKWVKEHIFCLEQLEVPVPLEGKDYLKIFFVFAEEEATRKAFQNEGYRYLLPNIYNNNDFNLELSGEMYGVPNDNMGLNAKKIYLEHKTRGITVPYLMNKEEVLLQRKFFDYLYNQVSNGKEILYVDMSNRDMKAYKNGELPSDKMDGLFLQLRKGKTEAEIHRLDQVIGFRPTLKKKFQYKNILGFDLEKDESKKVPTYGRIKSLKKMQELVHEVLFSNYLITNYYTEAADISIKDSVIKTQLILTREKLIAWFYTGNASGVEPVLDRASLELVKNSVSNGHRIKAIHQFNFRLSIQDYFNEGENTMEKKVNDIVELVREKINANDTRYFESEEEYYFGVGQVIMYFVSLSKAGKKTHSLANPFLKEKSGEQLKKKLRDTFHKYNYTIEVKAKRFNRLFAMIAAYEESEKINEDMLLAGYLSNSLIYEKSKEEK